jgi:hypothetical protein
VLRPGDGDEIESKRAAHVRVHSHPGGGCPAYVPPLSLGDGFRGGLRTRSTGLDLDEDDLATAGADEVDLISSRTPVSREDSITGAAQQACGKILPASPQLLAIRVRTGFFANQIDLRSVWENRNGRSSNQLRIKTCVWSGGRGGSFRLQVHGQSLARQLERPGVSRLPDEGSYVGDLAELRVNVCRDHASGSRSASQPGKSGGRQVVVSHQVIWERTFADEEVDVLAEIG